MARLIKTLSRLDLESKGQGHSKKQKPMPWGTKNMPPKQHLSNWCDADADEDADADTDICKTICRPPPYGGRHNYLLKLSAGRSLKSGGLAWRGIRLENLTYCHSRG